MLFSCHWPLLTYLTSAHLCISAAILNHQLSWYSYSLAPLGRGVIWCVGVSTSAVIGGSLLCYLLAPGRAGVALDMWACGWGDCWILLVLSDLALWLPPLPFFCLFLALPTIHCPGPCGAVLGSSLQARCSVPSLSSLGWGGCVQPGYEWVDTAGDKQPKCKQMTSLSIVGPLTSCTCYLHSRQSKCWIKMTDAVALLEARTLTRYKIPGRKYFTVLLCDNRLLKRPKVMVFYLWLS